MPLRVLHVIPSVGPLRGGPSVVVRTITSALADEGVHVDVIATDDNGPERMKVEYGRPQIEGNVSYRYFPRQTRFYSCSLPMTSWLWENAKSYDLLHIHAIFSYPSNVASWIAQQKSIPYFIRPLGVLNHWGMENRRPWLKTWSYRLIERRILERAAAVHYTSEQEKIEAESLGFQSQSVIIPNPVELPISNHIQRGSFRSLYPKLAGRTIVLFLSRLDPKKGLDLLLPAFANVLRQAPNCVLVIAGDGDPDFVASLHALARQHNLDQDVIWAGFLQGDAKMAALIDADVFVLPSYSENFGVAPVEAMAAKLPVLVSDKVGIHSDITRAGAGLVCSTNVDSVGQSLLRLVTDTQLRSEMGDKGQVLARNSFSKHAVVSKLIKCYNQATSASAAAK